LRGGRVDKNSMAYRMSGNGGDYNATYGVRYASKDYYFADGRTYEPLYMYFKPVGFYDDLAYFSTTYNKTYYDGYGYNFYTGNYGYYEKSENTPTNNDALWVSLGSLAFCMGCMCCLKVTCYGKGENSYLVPDSGDDSEEKARKRAHNQRID